MHLHPAFDVKAGGTDSVYEAENLAIRLGTSAVGRGIVSGSYLIGVRWFNDLEA